MRPLKTTLTFSPNDGRNDGKNDILLCTTSALIKRIFYCSLCSYTDGRQVSVDHRKCFMAQQSCHIVELWGNWQQKKRSHSRLLE